MLKICIGTDQDAIAMDGNIREICTNVLVALDGIYTALNRSGPRLGQIFKIAMYSIPELPLFQGKSQGITIDLSSLIKREGEK